VNDRTQQKRETKQRILKAAKEEFIRNGFLETNTKTIADKAGVAHGTLFLHFPTKHALIEKVLEAVLINLDIQLEKMVSEEKGLEGLLSGYLDFIRDNETFFEVLAIELPHYPKDIRIKAYLNEASARNYFYDIIRRGVALGIYKKIDIKMALTFLFGTINYYLSNKRNILKEGSIIERKKDAIIETFLSFIKI
jgi:AcrR family transcriptional regulator